MEHVYSQTHFIFAVEYGEQLKLESNPFAVCWCIFSSNQPHRQFVDFFFPDCIDALFLFSCFLPVFHFLPSHFLVTSVKVLITPLFHFPCFFQINPLAPG